MMQGPWSKHLNTKWGSQWKNDSKIPHVVQHGSSYSVPSLVAHAISSGRLTSHFISHEGGFNIGCDITGDSSKSYNRPHHK